MVDWYSLFRARHELGQTFSAVVVDVGSCYTKVRNFSNLTIFTSFVIDLHYIVWPRWLLDHLINAFLSRQRASPSLQCINLSFTSSLG